MKKLLLLLFLCFLTTPAVSNPSDYQTWGTLSGGGVKSIVSRPSNFYGLTKTKNIDPSDHGYPLHFSIAIKATEVVAGGRLWVRLDGPNGQIELKSGTPIKGTHNWKVYSLTIPVVRYPANRVVFGVWLSGSGKIEMANYRIN